MSENTNNWVELEVAEMDEVQGGYNAKGNGHISLGIKGTGPFGRQASVAVDAEGGFDVTVTP